jgi:hypothetical protein
MDKLPNEELTVFSLDIGIIEEGNGIEPVFTLADMQKLKMVAAENMIIQKYYVDAYLFVDNYRRNELPWKIMSKRQREWLWEIKDDLDKRKRR